MEVTKTKPMSRKLFWSAILELLTLFSASSATDILRRHSVPPELLLFPMKKLQLGIVKAESENDIVIASFHFAEGPQNRAKRLSEKYCLHKAVDYGAHLVRLDIILMWVEPIEKYKDKYIA